MNTTVKTPSHSCPSYVVTRIRKLLAAKGWSMQKTKGRYSAFGSTKVSNEGFNVHKVGCSKTVTVSYSPSHYHGSSSILDKGFARARVAEAVEYLRSVGYRVDDRGWLECDGYDMSDF